MRFIFYRKSLRRIFILLTVFLFSSCVYFNTFYNAKVAYKDALRIINLMDYKEMSIPPESKRLLDFSIANSRLVIEKYSKSKYVEEAYYLLASAMFLKDDYISSREYLNILIENYPNGEYYNEAKLRLASIELRTGNLLSAISIIEYLESEDNLNRYERYLINTIHAEKHIIDNNIALAYSSYQDAINNAINDPQRIKVYNKLIQLSEKERDYGNILIFIDGLYRNTDLDSEKKELKLLSLEYNKRLKRYDYLIPEIEGMLNQSLFEDKRLFLSMELAKAYYYLQDYLVTEELLMEILDIYSKKNETAEAYYFLAQMNIKNDFNLEVIKELLNKSKTERSNSKYGKMSKEFLRTIADFETLLYEYNDSLAIEDSQIRKDSLLFDMGQSYYFDFKQADSSITKHKQLVDKFPASKFIPKSLFVLSILDSTNQLWVERLKSEYPENNFENSKNENLSKMYYSEAYYDALNLLELGFYDKAYPILEELNLNNENKESLFYLGYLNEVYISNSEDMLAYYIEYLNKGENANNRNYVKEKLSIYYYMFNRKLENLYLRNQISKCLSGFKSNRQNSQDSEALKSEKEALFESIWFDCNIEGVSELDTTKVGKVSEIDFSDESLKIKYENMNILTTSWSQFKRNIKFIDDSFEAFSLNDSLELSIKNYISSLDLKVPVQREDPPVTIDSNFSYILSSADIEANTSEIVQLQNYISLYNNLSIEDNTNSVDKEEVVDPGGPILPGTDFKDMNINLDRLNLLKK